MLNSKYIVKKTLNWLTTETKKDGDEIVEFGGWIYYKENMPYKTVLELQKYLIENEFQVMYNDESAENGNRSLMFRFENKSYDIVEKKAKELLKAGFEKEFNFRDDIKSFIKIETTNYDFVPKCILDLLDLLYKNDKIKVISDVSSGRTGDDGNGYITTCEIIYTGGKK